MKKLVDMNGTVYKSEDAEKKAKELSLNDSDWTYKAVHDPKGNGYAYIAILDEDGNMIGKF